MEWKRCRFYLSPNEQLVDKEERMTFIQCRIKNLPEACGAPNLAVKATASASSCEPGNAAAKGIDKSAATCWKLLRPPTSGKPSITEFEAYNDTTGRNA